MENSYSSPWLNSKDIGEKYKKDLVDIYEKYYNSDSQKEKANLIKDIEVCLAIVCDVIAYRYLKKHYSNLFFKLNITIEEYIDYKVQRLVTTIKNKEEHIDDILGYVYMSFMLSSPRLIYDYGEEIGRCKLIKHNLPYYQVVRNKFFDDDDAKQHYLNNKYGNICDVENEDIVNNEDVKHVIYNVDTLYIENSQSSSKDDTLFCRSNIERFSFSSWKDKDIEEMNKIDIKENIINIIEALCNDEKLSEKSKTYINYIFSNWESFIEDDYQKTKIEFNLGDSYSLTDYINCKQSKNETGLTVEEYQDTLKILNNLIKLLNNKEKKES